jgi:four helix bundle protein
MQDYKELSIWNKAHQLTLEVYHLTAKFPKEEMFGVTLQLRRATESVPSNIARGCALNSSHRLVKFLNIALEYANESLYFLYLSKDLKYISIEEYERFENYFEEIVATIISIIQRIKKQEMKNNSIFNINISHFSIEQLEDFSKAVNKKK